MLPAAQTLPCHLVAHVRQAVTLAGATQREAPVPDPAVVAAPAAHLGATRALTSNLVAQFGHSAARVALARCGQQQDNTTLQLNRRIHTGGTGGGKFLTLAAVGSETKRQRSAGVTATANHVGFTFTDPSQFAAGRADGPVRVTLAG